MFAAKQANLSKLKKPKSQSPLSPQTLNPPTWHLRKETLCAGAGEPMPGSWFDIEPPATGGRFASTLVSEIDEARSIVVWATSTDVWGQEPETQGYHRRGGAFCRFLETTTTENCLVAALRYFMMPCLGRRQRANLLHSLAFFPFSSDM